MSKEDKRSEVHYDFSDGGGLRRAALWGVAIMVSLAAVAILIGKGD